CHTLSVMLTARLAVSRCLCSGLCDPLCQLSFPTRRSSDLFFRAVQDVTVAAEGHRGRGVVYWEPAWTAVEGAGWDPEDPSSGNRSEEHTSELQSRFDLVCRLLLEKKKRYHR